MGCTPSKNRNPDIEFPISSTLQHNDPNIPTDRPTTELQILDILKQEYNENFELFVVNNLLFAVVFFENFNEDIKILQPNSEREMEIFKLNERLLNEFQKKIILPDTLHEKVNRNIRFQRPHGPDKGKSESLLPERIFIVDDNVEISHVDEDAYYSIDNNTFRAALIETDNVGFVKLRQMDKKETDTVSPKRSEDNIYMKPQASTSAAAEVIENNYAELEQARSREPLVIAMDRNLYSTIPRRCIVPVPLVTTEMDYNEQETDYVVRKITVTENYISSKEMAKYFLHVEFPRRIGPQLAFSSEELQNAEKMLATIYLQSNRSGYPVDYEVTTVLDIQWPKFCTLQWFRRRPKKIKDKVNLIIYEWPSDMMKDVMQTYKCVVIPRSFLQKYGTNKQRSLEWEIAYPRVEKYLQTTMSHAQLKTYFLLILLHKSFIEPVTKHQGIIADHIKTIMYWEIENNFLQWPETRMGRKLRQILIRLEDSLSRRRQQHYFHHSKNIFGNIPDQYLYEAQTIVNKIVQNPVPYVISALQNIQYSNPGNFYPTFDYNELYRQLKDDVNIVQPVQRIDQIRRTVTFNRGEHKTKPAIKRQEAVDPIDLKWFCKIGPTETIRRRHVLIMFIKHFIEIGKQSSSRMITEQALLYLQHAMDLTLILDQEGPLHKVVVDQFMRQIETEQSRVRQAGPSGFSTDSMESPALPSRVSTLRTTLA